MTTHLRIGDLAKLTHCQVETIRFYEREGLLPQPLRSDNNYRLYGAEHVERLSFIRHCRLLGMAHDEIRTLLDFRESPQTNCTGVNQMLDEHITHVADRIAELKKLKKYLTQLRSLCIHADETQNCEILRSLGVSTMKGDASTISGATIENAPENVHFGLSKMRYKRTK